jgi:hypothetical protein
VYASPGSWKVRLADGCWYKPDVFAVTKSGNVWIIEVKGGFVREDARIKFKVAAEHNKWARWSLVQWKERRWHTLHDTLP